MPMFGFWDFIANNVKFKREKFEEAQFCKSFEKEIKFLSNKNEVRGRVNVESLRC